MLRDAAMIGFIPTTDGDRAKQFFAELLGLEFVVDAQFALVFRVGGGMLRVVRMDEFTPVPYTILGWEVEDLTAKARELAGRGVEITRYGFLEQDEHGVWVAPDGDKVLWFKDPDGNTLSLSQQAERERDAVASGRGCVATRSAVGVRPHGVGPARFRRQPSSRRAGHLR